ncbi:MAG: histidine triad nucleotide-binding protein [Anaerolineales bacterium]|nr:histidine triad nucleotide-binding protein [Anaerolineales bacterium]MCW5854539.1 histidine triad nucleotide-binding protein [Anaerolineales bacterium]
MTEANCIFCKIIAGELPAEMVYQDEQVSAFRDLHPKAPIHILIVPNMHIPSTNQLTSQDVTIAGHLLAAAPKIAEIEGIFERGYRLIANTGSDGRQEVPHLHIHFLGGQPMQHPLG